MEVFFSRICYYISSGEKRSHRNNIEVKILYYFLCYAISFCENLCILIFEIFDLCGFFYFLDRELLGSILWIFQCSVCPCYSCMHSIRDMLHLLRTKSMVSTIISNDSCCKTLYTFCNIRYYRKHKISWIKFSSCYCLLINIIEAWGWCIRSIWLMEWHRKESEKIKTLLLREGLETFWSSLTLKNLPE